MFKANRSGYLDLAVDKSAIKTSIHCHPEFTTFIASMNNHFAVWRNDWIAKLKALSPGFHPKQLIVDIGESLLARYADRPLIDAYDIYQHLLDYWATTMQDDAYLVAAEGWQAKTYRLIEKDKKGKEKDKGWACDLLPKPLIVARYFAAERAAIEQLGTDLESAAAQLAELEEEHGSEDDVFAGFDKINSAGVKDRIKEIGKISAKDKEAADELAILQRWLALAAKESALKKRLREAEAELDLKAYAHYPKLSAAEIQTLVVEDKWLAALDASIHGEMDRVSQALTGRVRELAERYENPLPQMVDRVAELEARVSRHLERMGFAWK